PGAQGGARGRVVAEGAGQVSRGVELVGAQRGAVDDAGRVGPGDRRGGPVHGERNVPRHALVVGAVGRGEGDRQRMGAGAQDSAGGRVVGEGAGDVGGGVQLGAVQRRAVGDGGRVGPGDRRDGPVHGERHVPCHAVVVGAVGGGEGDRQRVAPGAQD